MTQNITVELYPRMDSAGAAELFTEINRSEPVLHVDLPEGGATDDVKDALSGAAQALSKR